MNIYPKALLIGVLVDILISVIIVPFVFWLAGASATSPYILQLSLFAGLLAIAAGGFATATFARSSKIANAGLFGVVEVMLGIGLSFLIVAPAWFNVASLGLMIPASIIGGYVAISTSVPSRSETNDDQLKLL